MDFLYDISLTCLYCNSPFKTKKPRFSRLPLKSRDTDFYLRYEYLNPYFYEVAVCPQCGMAFTDKFRPLSPIAKAKVAHGYITHMQREDFCQERSLDQGLRSIKLAMICATLCSESPLIYSSLCLRGAWLNRERGNTQEESVFMQKAYETFEHIYSNVRFDELKISESYLLHMLAELSCRLDEPDRARRWFGQLFMHNDKDYKYLDEARDRWLDYKQGEKG